MVRFAMQGLMAVSMLFAACATEEAAPSSTSDHATSEDPQGLVEPGEVCTAVDRCSTTGSKFIGGGTSSGAAVSQAMFACKPNCAGGTCTITGLPKCEIE